jgi:hypothetical protein
MELRSILFALLLAFLSSPAWAGVDSQIGARQSLQQVNEQGLQSSSSSPDEAVIESFRQNVGQLPEQAMDGDMSNQVLCRDFVVLSTPRVSQIASVQQLLQYLRPLAQREVEVTQWIDLGERRASQNHKLVWMLVKVPGLMSLSADDRADFLRLIRIQRPSLSIHHCFHSQDTNRMSGGNK